MKVSDFLALGDAYIACVDLEATCDNNSSFDRRQMEIIEIGVILLNPEYSIVGTFNSFVRPTINPTLTSFCKELTTITQEQVDTAQTWDVVAGQLDEFFMKHIEEECFDAWTSWGDFDRKLIERECERWNVTSPMSPIHYNLKSLDASHRNTKKERGLMGAVKAFGLDFPGTQHRADADALAVSMVWQKLIPGIIRSKL